MEQLEIGALVNEKKLNLNFASVLHESMVIPILIYVNETGVEGERQGEDESGSYDF